MKYIIRLGTGRFYTERPHSKDKNYTLFPALAYITEDKKEAEGLAEKTGGVVIPYPGAKGIIIHNNV